MQASFGNNSNVCLQEKREWGVFDNEWHYLSSQVQCIQFRLIASEIDLVLFNSLIV